MDKTDCQEVQLGCWASGIPKFVHYCPIHKLPYDKTYTTWREDNDGVLTIIGTTKFFKTIPAHEVEVDEEGREITKKKRLLKRKMDKLIEMEINQRLENLEIEVMGVSKHASVIPLPKRIREEIKTLAEKINALEKFFGIRYMEQDNHIYKEIKKK